MDWRKKPRQRLTAAALNIRALQALLPRGAKRERLITGELERDAKNAARREKEREQREEKQAIAAALAWRDRQEKRGEDED